MPWDIIFRTLIGFSVLLLLTRLIGKKQLGQITYFTYITGIAMGNIAGDMVVHKDITVKDGVTGLIIWMLLTVLIEKVSLNSGMLRVLLDGEPSIVIKKGQIQQRELRKSKLNMDDLTMLLRSKDVFAIDEVDYAILEPNGQLSVLKKPTKEIPTKEDLNLPVKLKTYLPSELIVDGKIVKRNLKEFGLTMDWLFQQLNSQEVNALDSVFYAELKSDGTLLIVPKDKQ